MDDWEEFYLFLYLDYTWHGIFKFRDLRLPGFMCVDKEGIAMKKLVSKLLLAILAVLVAFCGLIVACAMDPSFEKEVAAFANSLTISSARNS